ncbi:uncharacterized protein LOC119459047 [Dermacentor silvarum]|uniref:uncharacterized protein LOC119459047 n=1 Tax=Dermacentor silvarum TaxID=543639 RepID=UPI00189858D6|nr:uncharacterized protein LOC119459047 [Dermacentor silvarum]
MSLSEYPFPVKERDPREGRYDLPKYVVNSYGDYVMEMLLTEELPEPPPADTAAARIRFILSLAMAVLLCGVTGLGVAVILQNSGAFFDQTSRDADDAEATGIWIHGGMPFPFANDSWWTTSDDLASNDTTSNTSSVLTGTEQMTWL